MDYRALAVRFGHAVLRAGVRLPSAPLVDRFREQQCLRDCLRRLGTSCVLDVGANRGQFGTTLRRIGYRGRLVSFEPILEESASLSRLAENDPHWEVHACAVGDEEGERTFNVVTVGGGQTIFSSLHAPNEAAQKLASGQMKLVPRNVPVRRLDGLLDSLCPAQRGEKLFLKSDTQGHDLEVLRGARGGLGRIDGILVEVGVEQLYEGTPSYTEILAFLQNNGFALMNLAVVNRTPLGAIMEYDALMVRPEAMTP